MTFGINAENVENLLECTRNHEMDDAPESVVAFKEQSAYESILETLVVHYIRKSKECNELSGKYVFLKDKYIMEQVRRIAKENELKIAIYPYGVQGKRIEQLLHDNGIRTDLIIDNNLSVENSEILSTDDLKRIDVWDYLFVICSDNKKIYKDIRQTIYHIVPQRNVFDWYSIDKEG